jgi:hypothetical protein
MVFKGLKNELAGKLKSGVQIELFVIKRDGFN